MMSLNFGIKPFVVINKKDLNEDNRQKIIKFCNSANTEIIGKYLMMKEYRLILPTILLL